MQRELWIRIVYELWPWAVGVRAGWADAGAEAGLGLRELVQVWIPAYRRLALEASRRGWRGWPEFLRRHAAAYAERGDATEDGEVIGYVVGLCGRVQRRLGPGCNYSLGDVRQAVQWWEGLTLVQRQVLCREVEGLTCSAV